MRLNEAQKTLLAAVQQAGSEGYQLNKSEYSTADSLARLELLQISPTCEEYSYAFLRGRGHWPMWAIEHFPTPGKPEEVGMWAKITWHYPLHLNVLVAANTRLEGTWKAYCAAVPGMDHAMEESMVLAGGDQLGEEIARAIFPHMKGIPYAK